MAFLPQIIMNYDGYCYQRLFRETQLVSNAEFALWEHYTRIVSGGIDYADVDSAGHRERNVIEFIPACKLYAWIAVHLANSTVRVSRTTVTLISPG